jgi:ketosteroid isomerase-like protein
VDKAQVSDWLRRYVEAWKSYDRSDIGALFSNDVEYRFHPYDDPTRGRDTVIESWFGDNKDDPGTYNGEYEPVAVDGNTAVAVGTSTYLDASGSVSRVYDNCFIMQFDDDGRCRSFIEYYMKRP